MFKPLHLFVLCALLFAAFSVATAQDAPVLIVAADVADVITLDPARSFETTNLIVQNATYETLIKVPPSDLSALEPGLATEWTISEDGLIYTFTLREGVTFASGNALTAEDVRWSWTRLKNIKGNPSFYADAIASIEAVDDLTVQVTLGAPTPSFLSQITVPAMSILDSQTVSAQGGTDAEDADVTDTAQAWLDQNSAGTGPFTLTGWTPNTEVTMMRNDNYWGGAVALGGVSLVQVNDSTTGLQQLERGDVDVVDNIEKDLAEQVLNTEGIRLEVGQSLNLSYLAMTPDPALSEPLGNQAVRQAIAYAVDFQGIADGLLLGYADRPAAMLPIGVQSSDGSLRYERDLDMARQLLADAGYADGFDLTLYLSSSGACGIPPETIGAKVQADLAEVGVNVTLDIQQSSNFLTAYRAQELPFLMATWTPDFLDGTMWSDYFAYADVGPAFRIRLNVPELEEVATAAAAETDPAARDELYAQYEQIHVDRAIFVPICQNQLLIAMNDAVQGFQFHPVYFYNFADMSIAE